MFKNLWNEKKQKKYIDVIGNTQFDFDLGSRVYTSRLIGSIPDLVMHGGGNTSCKSHTKNIFNENMEVICVKGSGWDLETIEAKGLPSIRLEPLLNLRKLKKLSDLYDNLEIIDWEIIKDADVYINATSVGLNKNDKLNLDLSDIKNKLFYDVIYNPKKTNFLEEAEKNKNRIANGKMMFLYQAQASFKIWTGVEPVITEEVIKTLND